jgi:hypothetical protein
MMEESMSQELIQDKIRRLLNLASNNANENEAAAAMSAANKLAEQYRIEIANLEVSGNSEPLEDIVDNDNPFISGGRIRNWKTILLDAIVQSQGCVTYLCRFGRGHHGITKYYVVGRSSDIEISRNMFNWALHELEFIGVLCCKGKGKRYANGWYNGAVAAISQGLKEGKEKARENVSTTALTVVDNRRKESENFMRKTHNLKTIVKRTSPLSAEGYRDGHAVGSKMNIQGTKSLK